MRIFQFKLDGKSRFFDMDHIQSISGLEFNFRESELAEDRDGLPFWSSCYGHARFRIWFMFQDKPEHFDVNFTGSASGKNRKEESDKNASKAAAFKAEYERLFSAWSSVDGQRPAFSSD